MYETYTRQSLPTKEYRELLGSALNVFNSNNSFIIENIIKTDCSYDWYILTDKMSGYLIEDIRNTITTCSNSVEIGDLFHDIKNMRDRIVHGFGITSKGGEQVLAAKTKINDGNEQYEITKEYLMEFIKKNEKLSSLLHKYRGYWLNKI